MSTSDSKYFEAANADSIDEFGSGDCSFLPPIYPVEVRDLLPMRIAVSFTLTEWTCVYRELYEEFAVQSVEQAVSNLVKHHEVFLIYRLYSETITPAWAYAVDWPLRRRSRSESSVQKQVPHGSETQLSNVIFEIRNRPLGPYKSRLMLKTGGRTAEGAVKRWDALALALRQQLRNSAEIASTTNQ
jgi:hypothetical protein